MATVLDGSGGGVFDNAVMFLSSGNLTATSTVPSAGLKIRGTHVNGSAARVVFPSTPGTAAQVAVAIHASADDSTYRVIASYPGGALSWASGGKEIMLPFAVPSGYPYVKMVFTVTGGTTDTSWGAVKAGIVPRAHGVWTRAVRWD